jgi:hypothetical protein
MRIISHQGSTNLEARQPGCYFRGLVFQALAGIGTVLLIGFSTAISALAQTAQISGVVTDSTGAVLQDARVTAANSSTGINRATRSSSEGYYAVPLLQPGTYVITVSASGFSSQIRSDVTLNVGDQPVLNFKLEVGKLSQDVQVTGAAPTVELSTSSISGVVSSDTVRELPLNGRDWTLLATLQPAVTQVLTQQPSGSTAHRGTRGNGNQLSIAGTRPQTNNYRIDGISVVDYAGGSPGSVIGEALGVDAVSEFSVITSNYDAGYGRTAGGVVNAITRSGTNQFHGDVYEFLRNSALDARNYFDIVGNAQPPFKRNQFGAAMGAPIQKNKTFIFGDYEGFRQTLGVTTVNVVPSPDARSGILKNADGTTTVVAVDSRVQPYLAFFPLPNSGLLGIGNTGHFDVAATSVSNGNFATVRLDHKLSEKDSVYGTWLYDTGLTDQPDTFNEVLNGNTSSRQMIALDETHLFSPTLFNTLRGGYSNVDATDSKGLSAINPLAADTTLGTFSGRPATQIAVSGLTTFSGGVGALGQNRHDWNSYQGYDDVFLTVRDHSLKFGAVFERMQTNYLVSPPSPNGSFKFGSLATFLTDQPTTFTGGLLENASGRGVRQSLFGGYLQDDWRWRPNLTVNLGLRYEAVTVPSEINGKLVNLRTLTATTPHIGSPYINNPTFHNVEPRVGVAWDPFGTGLTAVRAAFGFFDILPLQYQFQQAIANSAPFTESITAANLPAGSFPIEAATLASPANFASAAIQFSPRRNYVMTWNVNVQQQFTSSMALMVGYVGNHGVHMLNREDDADSVLPNDVGAEGLLFPFPAGSGTRLNTSVGSIRSQLWTGDSEYDALEVQLTKRMSHGFQIQGSYTWGKALDTGSVSIAGDDWTNSISSLFYFCRSCRRGPSDFNIAQAFVGNYIWDLPAHRGWGPIADSLLGGWELGGILNAQSGLPVTPLIGGDPLGLNSSDPYDFPVHLNSPACHSLTNSGSVSNYINLRCFALPLATPDIAANCTSFKGAPGTCQNLLSIEGSRNIVAGPSLTTLDFALYKNTYIKRISESFNAQFRVELFNSLNHPNFATPSGNETLFDASGNSVAAAGSLNQTSTTAREVQFALKLIW